MLSFRGFTEESLAYARFDAGTGLRTGSPYFGFKIEPYIYE